MKIKLLFFSVLVSLGLFFSSFQNKATENDQLTVAPPFLNLPSPWADSVHARMSLEDKIGQLFSIAAYSNKGAKHKQEILDLIQKYKIGGLTFFQGGPVRQALLTNDYQKASEIPLMIAIDGEWGLSMRLDSTVKYPWQMTLGAIQDDSLIYRMGLQIAEQFRRVGVHVNFAPVVDVNNNPNNPVIFARSFGEDKKNVARKGIAYMKGMQDGRLLANAKHFPGHGDTDTDSHVTLPVVKHSKERMDSIELYPFRAIVEEGIGSMMTAHLHLPELTSSKKASSLTAEVVDTLLKQELGFKGLIFTDGLNMGGVAKYQSSEEIDLQALMAGNDVLLLSQNVGKAVELIKVALKDGRLSEASINASSLKILKAKEWLGLNKSKLVATENLYKDLNQSKYEYLNRNLVEASLTMLRNEADLLPIKNLSGKKIVVLSLAKNKISYRPFQEGLNRYARVDTLHYSSLPVAKQKALMDTLLTYDEVIISIHKSNKHPWIKAKIDTEFKNFVDAIRRKKKASLILFGNAYGLKDFLGAEYINSLVVAYQNSEAAQDLGAQLIFGGVQAKGKLPVSASQALKAGMGIVSLSSSRLKYTLPEELNLNSLDLEAIDNIVDEGIKAKAFPGAQVYVAKSGKVIYNKAFGKPTYESNVAVKSTDLYDIASVTKISSSLLALMDLDGQGKLSLDDKLGKHLKMTKGTAYKDLILRDMLAHQAGLAAWIPFYNKTLIRGQPRFDIYSKSKSDKYPIQVAKDFYMIDEYRDTIFYRILHRAKINPKKGYKYSDVGYYFMKEVIEETTGDAIEDYNQENFYESLGMSRTTFKPLEKFELDEIIPTEYDKVFRKQQIHGYVHDPGAAMLGGVGGHAGLFSTANDLGKLMQMYLDDGVYAEKRYLKEGIVKQYAKCQFCEDSIPKNKEENRRGAGFDKPQFHGNPGPTCECVSMNSFGHSGFTGTFAWVDPEEELVYVFLSNRIYPSSDNRKLLDMNIRTRIQEEIYKAINNSKVRTSPVVIN